MTKEEDYYTDGFFPSNRPLSFSDLVREVGGRSKAQSLIFDLLMHYTQEVHYTGKRSETYHTAMVILLQGLFENVSRYDQPVVDS